MCGLFGLILRGVSRGHFPEKSATRKNYWHLLVEKWPCEADLLQASWTDGAAPLGMHEALERARRVDVACAALDAQVVINLALGEAISTMSFSRMCPTVIYSIYSGR